MTVDVTISIVNHENREAVLESLAALLGEPDRRTRIEIIVVDNASQDGSAAAIRDMFADVEVIARPDRDGYGANHNLVLRRARGRHVLLLNDDTVVKPGAIDALTAHLDANPHAAIACPTIRGGDGHVEPSLWPRPSPVEDVLGLLRLGRARPLLPDAADSRQVGWATGCALLARRDAVLALGGFDEQYFMYSEEIDLCTRLADAGHSIEWVFGAEVTHIGQVSTGGHASPGRAVEMARSRRRYWRCHYGPVGRAVARAAVSVQFAALAGAARLGGRPAKAFALQAMGCWRDPKTPGMREAAEAFNREARTAAP